MPKNPRADQTILNPATSKGASLRTTIPAFIVSQFGLRKGDSLKWSIDSGRLMVEILKVDDGIIRRRNPSIRNKGVGEND